MGVVLVGVYDPMDGPQAPLPLWDPYQLETEWGLPRPRCAPEWGVVYGRPTPAVNCFQRSPPMGDGVWRMGPKLGEGSTPRGEIVRDGRGPLQLPDHRRLKSWAIDLAEPWVGGMGGRRIPAPSM